jgi:hypothetical protein
VVTTDEHLRSVHTVTTTMLAVMNEFRRIGAFREPDAAPP